MTILMILWLPGDPWTFHWCSGHGQMVLVFSFVRLLALPCPSISVWILERPADLVAAPLEWVLSGSVMNSLSVVKASLCARHHSQSASADRASLFLSVFSLLSLLGTNRPIQPVEEDTAVCGAYQ